MAKPEPGRRGAGALYCYRCDAPQREGAKSCPSRGRYSGPVRGEVCGSVAFYRGRRPSAMAAEEEAPLVVAEAPVSARRTGRGHRGAAA